MEKDKKLMDEKSKPLGNDDFKGMTGKGLEDFADESIKSWGIKHYKEENKDAKIEETHRTTFRRQRDRILYSGGFRRLQDKTQVLAATKSGDHRTRLTHTMEVEQISTSLADVFGLNRDLVAAIALGHDVGHTPFGHAVERFLDKKLKSLGQGGFSHALQSVRYFKEKEIVLSNDIIEGIIKHDTDVYLEEVDNRQFDCSIYTPQKPGNLESQVVYWADKIAYITHDLDDFIKSGICQNATNQKVELEEELLSVIEELSVVGEVKKVFYDKLNDFNEKIKDKFKIASSDSNNEKEEKKLELSIIKKRIDIIENFIKLDFKKDKFIKKDFDKENFIKLDFNLEAFGSYRVRNYKKILLTMVRSLNVIASCTEISYIKDLNSCVEEFVSYLVDDELTIKNLELRNYIRPILDNLIENSIKNLNEISSKIKSKTIVEITCERIETEENSEKLKEKLKDLSQKKVKKLRKKCYQRGLIISFSGDYYNNYIKLRELINENYIFSPEVARSDAKAEKIADELFDRFMNNEKILPLSIKGKMKNLEYYSNTKDKTKDLEYYSNTKERIIADYIASMTDKYATEVYNDLNAIGSHYDY